MAEPNRLTPTSHIVLGLVALAGEVTPYELKQMVAASVGNMWSLPHAQLYVEPARLAAAGYLVERQEAGGRRRKRYSITERGSQALKAWLETPATEFPELRDLGLLKLYFGGDPKSIAKEQIPLHEEQLAEYRDDLATKPLTPGARFVLEAGVGHEREWLRFWRQFAK